MTKLKDISRKTKVCFVTILYIKTWIRFDKGDSHSLVFFFFPKNRYYISIKKRPKAIYMQDVPFSNEPLFKILTVGLNDYFGVE